MAVGIKKFQNALEVFLTTEKKLVDTKSAKFHGMQFRAAISFSVKTP
jgi:hypothetical protein